VPAFRPVVCGIGWTILSIVQGHVVLSSAASWRRCLAMASDGAVGSRDLLMVLARRRGHAGQYSARAVEAGDRLQAAAHGRSNLLRADVVEVLSPACDVRGSSGSNVETPWLGPRPQRSAGPAADQREVSLKGGRAPDHRRMIVTLKTQAPRRLSQAGDFCRVAPSALCRSAARGGLALRRRAARPFRLSALAQGASFSRDRAASRPTLRRAERDLPNLRRKSGFPDRCATAL
jgi:hypothetical protein